MGMTSSRDMSLYNERKKRLQTVVSGVYDIIRQLKMDGTLENLAVLKAKLDSDAFRVMVLGTFKNGKSTFLNALLGEDVLPAYATPTTAVINEIKYGREKKAILSFLDPVPDDIHSSIPDDIQNLIRSYHGRSVPSVDIPYDEIEDYVTIPMGEDPKELVKGSPYSKVDLFYPLEALSQGVELIDSPGLNEAATRTAVTLGYLPKVDAILFVLTADKLCSQQEMESLANELKDFTDSTFFIVNRFDLLRKESDRNRAKQFANLKLQALTSRGIYFISSLQALEAKENGNLKELNESGFPGLEKDIYKFLTVERGRTKFAQPVRALKDISCRAHKTIRERIGMLSTSLQDLEKRCRQVEPKLVEIRNKKLLIEQDLENGLRSMERKLGRAVRSFCKDLLDKIPTWVDEYQVAKRSWTETTFHPEVTSNAIAEEVHNYLNQKMISFSDTWSKSVFAPIVGELIAEHIVRDSERKLNAFYQELDHVSVMLTSNNNEEENYSGVSGWDRVKGAAVGALLMDPTLILSGSMHGLSTTMLKTLGIEFGGALLLSLVGLFNPVTAVALIASAIFYNISSAKSGIEEKAKKAVAKSASEQISKGADKIISDAVSKTSDKIRQQLIQPTINALEVSIRDLENQKNAALEEKRRGEQNVNRERKALEDCENKLAGFDRELDSIACELIGA